MSSTDALRAAMLDMGKRARTASVQLANAGEAARTAGLLAMADALTKATPALLEANAKDMASAQEKGISPAMLDRLMLDQTRVAGISDALRDIAKLSDPVGSEIARWTVPSGLDIARVRTPLGVIGIIYEARPNVTADAAALCLRSGNAAILRAGSESLHSAIVIADALRAGLASTGLPEDAIQLVQTKDRDAVGLMLGGLDGNIDIIIPRGGRSLVARVLSEARVPVFSHLEGVCHVYIHAAADPQKAVDIAVNSKMRRTGICGAAETLLIDDAVADALLPAIANALIDAGCTLKGDARARSLVPAMDVATEDDWRKEYLDATIAVRVIDGIDAAMAHIKDYGTSHTESIVTEDEAAAERFMAEVDSGIVIHNASTQFADGGQFGMGAEIGIATGRIHARGPVGAEQLTIFKYVVRGTGQVRP